MVKKWWGVFQRYLSRSLEYRAELVVWFLLSLLPTLLVILVWSSIFKEGQIEGYAHGSMIQYYLLVVFINESTASHFESRRVTEIREGKIDLFFTRPFSYQLDILIGDLAGKCMYLLMTLPLLLGTWWFLTRQVATPAFVVTLPTVLFFLTCLLIAYAIQFLIALLIVLAGFWLEEAEGLEHFKWLVISLTSGFFVPITFMPEWLRNVVEWLPFQYMFAVPIDVLQGKALPEFSKLWYPLIFILGLWAASQYLWKQALRRYASAGG